MKNGTYAYRFSGASMADGTAYHLVGVGLMTIKKGGSVTGSHRSSIVPLKGQEAALTHTVFSLSGQAKTKDGYTSVTITFTCTSATSNGAKLPVQQTLIGTFDFVPGGEDRYWLIGSGARNKTLKSWAAEAVSGEAVRLGD